MEAQTIDIIFVEDNPAYGELTLHAPEKNNWLVLNRTPEEEI